MNHISRKTRGELWLARCLKTFYGLKTRHLEEAPKLEFSSYGPEARIHSEFRPIPKIIWAYWNGTPPPIVQRCLDTWEFFNPHFEIRVLDDVSMQTYLRIVPSQLHELPPTKRSDWIRLELLRLYGGIWLDASTILTRSLDWVLEQQQFSNADFIGYYLEKYTQYPLRPVIENWFMAAPSGSPFITDVQQEFSTHVIPFSNEEYLENLKKSGIYEELLQKIDMPWYLSQHLAIQRVLHRNFKYRLCLAKAEDGPYFLHALGGWSRTPLKLRLMFSLLHRAPELIKLRSPDRKRLDLYLEKQLYVHGSIAQRYLKDLKQELSTTRSEKENR